MDWFKRKVEKACESKSIYNLINSFNYFPMLFGSIYNDSTNASRRMKSVIKKAKEVQVFLDAVDIEVSFKFKDSGKDIDLF